MKHLLCMFQWTHTSDKHISRKVVSWPGCVIPLHYADLRDSNSSHRLMAPSWPRKMVAHTEAEGRGVALIDNTDYYYLCTYMHPSSSGTL